MTKRLVLAIVATTAAALLLAGLGSLVLATIEDRRSTEAELRTQAEALAGSLENLAGRGSGQGPDRPVIATAALRRALQLEGLGLVLIGPAGAVTGELPDGVDAADLDVNALRAGDTVSGRNGDLVFAAAAVPATTRTTPAAVLTQTAGSGLQSGLRWFLLSSALTLSVAAVVATWVARRVIRPVRDADDATRQIAAGDFSTRLPEPPAAATDELADLTRSINTMAATLERSQTLEQQFLLSVSHDLRTPLTSIKGYAEAITDGADPRWASSVILRESERLERLVRDLLELARLEARSFSLAVEPVDLADVVRDVAAGLGPDAAAAGLTLEVHAARSAPVRGDRDRLAQVAANLVENATKYARTRIVVGATVADRTSLLWVDDDGPGIAAADLPHVFERLYVARHEPVRKESGSGLGLAIVRELVQAMGGTVAAEQAPRGGARLVVRLPAAGGPPAGSPAPGSPAATLPPPG